MNKLRKGFEELLKTLSSFSEDNKIKKKKVKILETEVKQFDNNPSSLIFRDHDIIFELMDREMRANT